MRFLKLIAAIAAIALILARVGLRDETLTMGDRAALPDEPEPILGYDGMDPDTLVDWLQSADADEETLERIRAYEEGFQNRQRVLDVIDDLIG